MTLILFGNKFGVTAWADRCKKQGKIKGGDSTDISSNLAYDYKRFEERSKQEVRTVSTKAKVKKHVVPVKAFCTMIAVVLMLSALIYTRVVQTELNAAYNQTVTELNAIKDENSRLQIKLEQTLSSANIEAIAREELQMQELDNSKVEYVEFNSVAKAEVLKKQSIFDTLSGWVMGLFS